MNDIELTIKPYDDEKLVYNKASHRYILSDDAMGDNVYFNDKIKLAKLNSQSMSLYNWIYNHNPYNKEYVEYILAHSKECRNMIFDALMECYMADMTTNYSAYKYQYDVKNEAEILDKLIPVSAKIAIENSYIGQNYIITNRFLVIPRELKNEDRYERYDY